MGRPTEHCAPRTDVFEYEPERWLGRYSSSGTLRWGKFEAMQRQLLEVTLDFRRGG